MRPGPIVTLWLLAGAGCTAASSEIPAGWTADAAVAPTLARLDQDQDGAVEATEWDAVASAEGPASRLSPDGDAEISSAELLRWMSTTDPLTFDGQPGRPVVTPDAQAPGTERRIVLLEELLLFLAAEVHASRPELPLPTPYHIQRAAQTGDLQSPEVQAILLTLRDGYTQAGRPFPAALQPLLRLPAPPSPASPR